MTLLDGKIKPFTNRAIYIGAILLMLLAVGSVVALFYFFPAATDVDARRVDFLRTASTLVVGGGGAAALLLAARRQRYVELKLVQDKEAASAVEKDASIRRANDLFTKAIESLGSDSAAVRLGALHSLSRVGDEEVTLREPVMGILCSYLQMPFLPPASALARRSSEALEQWKSERASVAEQPRSSIADSLATESGAAAEQELTVRLTAQSLLQKHLSTVEFRTTRDGGSVENPHYWSNLEVDLSDAVLFNFSADFWRVRRATFDRIVSIGDFSLSSCEISGYIAFRGGRFTDDLSLNSCRTNDAVIIDCELSGGITLVSHRKMHDDTPSFGTIVEFCSFDHVSVVDYPYGGFLLQQCTSANGAFFENCNFNEDVTIRGLEASVRFENVSFSDSLGIDISPRLDFDYRCRRIASKEDLAGDMLPRWYYTPAPEKSGTYEFVEIKSDDDLIFPGPGARLLEEPPAR